MKADLIPVKVWFGPSEDFETIHLEGISSEHLNSIKVGQRTYFFDKEGNYDGFGEIAIDGECVEGSDSRG